MDSFRYLHKFALRNHLTHFSGNFFTHHTAFFTPYDEGRTSDISEVRSQIIPVKVEKDMPAKLAAGLKLC